ncbi:hypothetical protein SAMN05660860_00137 [Geoalkalibacter ferrihydriticus]|uniref:Uncharacterized protein n=1 Tax=Geoalkalibacter ferrihydriticus TaxID=392333 RepID=A0A1G9IH62_9BACT|nr:hypothetical protein SAMN05660860_00137 [Geoalkalibacter ferrihydriticus]
MIASQNARIKNSEIAPSSGEVTCKWTDKRSQLHLSSTVKGAALRRCSGAGEASSFNGGITKWSRTVFSRYRSQNCSRNRACCPLERKYNRSFITVRSSQILVSGIKTVALTGGVVLRLGVLLPLTTDEFAQVCIFPQQLGALREPPSDTVHFQVPMMYSCQGVRCLSHQSKRDKGFTHLAKSAHS